MKKIGKNIGLILIVLGTLVLAATRFGHLSHHKRQLVSGIFPITTECCSQDWFVSYWVSCYTFTVSSGTVYIKARWTRKNNTVSYCSN